MSLRPGTIFANVYEIVSSISAGGMGVVYEVIHIPTRRRRAMKVMLPHIVTDPIMRERFSLEAVVTADIESEHLTEVFDAGIDKETDSPYLVMELLRGEDLGSRLKRGVRFTGPETLTFVEQIVRALEKTHARGIVHRDLKPENLFVTQRDDGSPRIKILDFGIAKLVKNDATGPQATTKTFGTPHYMAREQITGETALIGPACDLYAVGQIVFALLTGRPYFDDEAKGSDGNILTLLMAVGRGPSERATVRALRRGVELPRSFDAWFEKVTAANPKARFPSATAMLDGLRQVLSEPVRYVEVEPPPRSEPARASSDRVEPSFPTADHAASAEAFRHTADPQSITTGVALAAPKKRSRAAWLVVAGAVAGVAVGVAAWRFSGSSADPSATLAASPPSAVSTERVASSAPLAVDVATAAPAPTESASAEAPAAPASAPASSTPSAPPAPPQAGTAPRPSGQTKGAAPKGPSGPEVWEVR